MDVRRMLTDTPWGRVSFVGRTGPRRAVRLLVHGAGRRASHLLPWAGEGYVLAELPGHGAGPMMEGGLEACARAFDHALRARWPQAALSVVGESLGGLVALAMDVEQVVALDPPLAPSPILRATVASGALSPWAVPILSASHWSLLDRRPAHIAIAADSILDKPSIERLMAHPLACAKTLPGWHVLLDDQPEACRSFIVEALGELDTQAPAGQGAAEGPDHVRAVGVVQRPQDVGRADTH